MWSAEIVEIWNPLKLFDGYFCIFDGWKIDDGALQATKFQTTVEPR